MKQKSKQQLFERHIDPNNKIFSSTFVFKSENLEMSKLFSKYSKKFFIVASEST